MPTEPELLKAVLAAPDDDAPRMAYAAWCDTSSDPAQRARAEFIRIQLELGRRPMNQKPPPVTAWYREEQLLRLYRNRWAAEFQGRVDDFKFHRGFVEWVRLAAPAFLETAAALYALAPIRHVDLSGARAVIRQVAASPYLRPLLSLAIEEQGLGDAEAEVLAYSPNLARLQWLSLRNNRIGENGVEAFCRATGLPRLRELSLLGNPFDPREQFSSDDDLITDRQMPPEGVSLEAIFGRKAWLHGAADTVSGWHPDRFAPAQPAVVNESRGRA